MNGGWFFVATFWFVIGIAFNNLGMIACTVVFFFLSFTDVNRPS